MTLTEFLLARIAEDETEANVMLRQYREGGDVASRRWRRVLAECEAKRRIVEHHAGLTGDDAGQGYTSEGYGFVDPCCVSCGTSDEYAEPWPCPTIKALALPYADHPDYDEAWRP